MGRSQQLYRLAKRLIPGGTQLLSKRPEMFLPDLWPAYYQKAKGCQVWDLDGNKYIDMSYMGIGACILGYSDADVNRAVKSAVDNGNMSTLNVPEEIDLARLLLKLHPWAHMVRYARSGGEAMSIAVRIARAFSKKDVVLFCGYHGWHDWYLAANLASDRALDGHLLPGLNPLGVPRNLKGTAYPFFYNDTKGFLKLAKKYKNTAGVVVLETVRNNYPHREFLKTVMEITRKMKAVLIVDEITSGFRLNNAGAHLAFGLKPDIAVFAKGMSNGFPMAAIIGRKNIMEVAQDTFISSTYWTDRIGPVSAVATINKIIKNDVSAYLNKIGKRIQLAWHDLALEYGLKIKISGIYPLSHFSFADDERLILKTLFTRFMLEKGILATTSFYASYAHKERHILRYLASVREAFKFIAELKKGRRAERFLKVSPCHGTFKRLT